MTTFTEFGVAAGYPSTPLAQLPAAFQAAMNNAQTGKQTAADDLNMGSVAQGSGYCANPAFRQQLYCACVNAPIAYPECIFGACANAAGPQGSYKTTAMQATVGNAEKECPSSVTCIQVIEMGGSDNVASNVTQELNCGSGAGGAGGLLSDLEQYWVIIAMAVLILLLTGGLLASRADRPRPPGPSKTNSAASPAPAGPPR